jgi:hypothetical protein
MLGFLVGVVIGANLGVLLLSLCKASTGRLAA